MAERCQYCGKEIYSMLEVARRDLWDSREDLIAGGKCGSCGKLCCNVCFKNGACPSCNGRLKRSGGSVL